MKNSVSFTLYQFLENHNLLDKILVVAVSGGVDSMVLLDAFLSLACVNSIQLHVAHVHHGWRPDSDREFAHIQTLCEQKGIGFHGIHFNMSQVASDRENQARKLRRDFFEKIVLNTGAKGCFLAHHQGDLEETVLKRVLEGAHLSHLKGLEPVSKLGDTYLFRPFLKLPKEQLYAYARHSGVRFFEDETNLDPAYLRSRMRVKILPDLEREFGKNIGRSLVALSQESASMASYFEARYHKEVRFFSVGDKKKLFLFPTSGHFFEIQGLLLEALKQISTVFSRQIIRDVTRALIEKTEPSEFRAAGWEMAASKGFLFLSCLDKGFGPSEILEKYPFLEELLPPWVQKKISCVKHLVGLVNK